MTLSLIDTQLSEKNPLRDSLGRLLPGAVIGKGNKGNTSARGRPKSRTTQLREFERDYPDAYYDLMVKLYDNGIGGNSEDARYVVNRLRGMPHTSADLRVRGEIKFSAEDYADMDRLAALTRAEEVTLLAENAESLEDRDATKQEEG